MGVEALLALVRRNKVDPSFEQYVEQNRSFFQAISLSLDSVAGDCKEPVTLVEINARDPSCETIQQLHEDSCVQQHGTTYTQPHEASCVPQHGTTYTQPHEASCVPQHGTTYTQPHEASCVPLHGTTYTQPHETNCIQRRLPYPIPCQNTGAQAYDYGDTIFVKQLNRLKTEVDRASKHARWSYDTVPVHHQPMAPLHIH
jgi:hypothetical protein